MGKSVEQIVNQQVLRWLAERQADKKTSNSHAPASSRSPLSQARASQRPMITISRQYGAYGAEMGRFVADALKIDFHEQELVHQIAAHSQVRRQVVEALDERTQGNLRLWVDELITVRKFEASDYLHALTETVTAIARHSKGVIVGRGAHLILEPTRTLRVRAVAPLEARIEAVAQREGMSVMEARVKVTRVDQERAEFYQRYFSTNIADPLGFDLVVNTGTLSLGAGAQVISEAYRQRFG